VRTTKNKVAFLVAGLHRLEAARQLGWKTIHCYVIAGDEAEVHPWQIAENLQRAELTVLERAECIDELRDVIDQYAKVKQVAPPGGRQPRDTGINKTAMVHGLTKEEVRRAKLIVGISPQAKALAKELGLDDNQDALLKIARMPTGRAQIEQARAIYDMKSVARLRRVAEVVGEHPDAAAEIAEIEFEIDSKENKLAKLNEQVASRRKRIREIEDALIDQRVDVASMAVVSPRLALTEEADSPCSAKNETTPTMAVEGDQDSAFTNLVTAWVGAEEFRQAWDRAPEIVRAQFIADVLEGEHNEVQQSQFQADRRAAQEQRQRRRS
jgi:ParB-like chromosome segregation protein Spo0J